MFTLAAVASTVVIVFILLIASISRYKRCPSNKILVINGKVGKGETSRCIHGGAAFIIPIIQEFQFLDLTPYQIDIDLKDALSKQNIRVNVPSIFTIGISTQPEVMKAAAERLLGLSADQIQEQAKEIIMGQMRLVIATMEIEEINNNRDKFLEGIYKNVETEIEKIGLKLINVNIRDIKDQSGYLDALGKNAAAEALNNAKVAVAQKDRDGTIGQASAIQEQTIKVAQAQTATESGKATAEQEKRVNIAKANADAVTGENLSAISIAESTSLKRQKLAEAEKQATVSEKTQAAEALEKSYKAEQAAELARAERDRATQTANKIVDADIQRKEIEIAAEAEKTKKIKEAEGEGAATLARLQGQADGNFEILSKQAAGLKLIIDACGGDADKAATLLIIDKLPELVRTQMNALSSIKIDKITVWDSGGNSPNGDNSVAGFLKGFAKSVPPMNDLFKQAGLSLPEILGKPLASATEV